MMEMGGKKAIFLWGNACSHTVQMAVSEFIFDSPYRFVITRPANECHLLPSDLVFCAIPFNTTCYKTENVSSTQILDCITNETSVAPEKHPSTQHLSKVSAGVEKTSLHSNSRVYPLEPFAASDFNQGR